MQHHKIKFYPYKIFIAICAVLISVVGVASAFDTTDLQSIVDGTPYYFNSSSTCGAYGSVPIPTIGSTAATSGSWHSGINGPYYLEEFAIQVLEDLAQKTGKPTTNAVTQE